MPSIIKPALALVLIAALCACGTQPQKSASNITLIQPLSQVEWMEKTAAVTAPMHVTNNSLMMMR